MKHEPMTQERLEATASRAEAAERGPWEVANVGDNETSTFIDGPDGDVLIRSTRGNPYLSEEYVWVKDPNAQFIAHAREDIPALLAEVKRLRARLTVDDAMVKRGAFALARRRAEDPLARDRVVGHTLLVDSKAVLNAALDTGEGA